MSSVLSATALSKHYGKQAAVDRINLNIEPGRIDGRSPVQHAEALRSVLDAAAIQEEAP